MPNIFKSLLLGYICRGNVCSTFDPMNPVKYKINQKVVLRSGFLGEIAGFSMSE